MRAKNRGLLPQLGPDVIFVVFNDKKMRRSLDGIEHFIRLNGEDTYENILCGYLYVCDLAFVILKGIYDFEFLKSFFGDLLQRSHFFFDFFFVHLILN